MRPAFLQSRMQRLAARLTGARNAGQAGASAAGATKAEPAKPVRASGGYQPLPREAGKHQLPPPRDPSGRSGAADGAKWFPLPGNDRIEYGASGYVIMLRTDPKLTPYALFDPDSRQMAHGYVLKGLKEYGEQLASERAEFAL